MRDREDQEALFEGRACTSIGVYDHKDIEVADLGGHYEARICEVFGGVDFEEKE